MTLHLFFKFDIRFANLYVVFPESQEFTGSKNLVPEVNYGFFLPSTVGFQQVYCARVNLQCASKYMPSISLYIERTGQVVSRLPEPTVIFSGISRVRKYRYMK